MSGRGKWRMTGRNSTWKQSRLGLRQRPSANSYHPEKRGIFMAVTIVIPTPLRQFAGGSSEIEVQASTAGDALQELTAAHGELRKHLYNEQNNLRNFINVYVGDEDIRHLDGAN